MTESGLSFASGLDPRFPVEKFKVAQCYLCAFNPWWYRYTHRLTIHAFDGTKAGGDIAGTMRLVDLDLWVETHFALEASVEELAGQLRRALIASVRDIDQRLGNCLTREERELRNVALQLEITSVADEESEVLDRLSDHEIQVIVDRSYTFTRTAMAKYGVSQVPRDTSGVWRPEDFGWPRGLSAEEYYRKLKENDPTGSFSNSSGEGEEDVAGSEEGGKSQESAESSSPSDEESQESESGEQSSSGDEEESDQEQRESDSQDSSGSEDGGERGESSDEQDSEDGDAGEPGETDSDEDSDEEQSGESGGGDSEKSQEDSDTEDTGEQDDPDSGESGEQQGDSESNAESEQQPADQSESEEAPGESEGSAAQPSGAKDAMREQMRADAQKNWTARDFRLPEDEDRDYTVDDRKEEALHQLSEDMLSPEAASLAGWGIMPGNSFADYVYDRTRRGPKDWKKRIGTPIVNSLKSAQIRGMSDLSYSRRNPHQPEFGPVMPGMVGSTPSMVVLLDVSGSMAGSLAEMFDSLNEIMRHMSSTYRTQCTWITADAGIIKVGKGSTLTEKIVRETTSLGFGGTVTGPIIEELASKQVIHEGRKIKAPDVLVFITDGLGPKTLPWPSAPKLPRVRSRIIIGRVLPPWLPLGGEEGLGRPEWATEKNWIDLSVNRDGERTAQSLAAIRAQR